jgi:hypothetical protein
MANAVKLRETVAVIRQNQHRWLQASYASGKVNPDAKDWTECSTSFCLAGWRCVMDGLQPLTIGIIDPLCVDEDPADADDATFGFYDPADPTKDLIAPYYHAMNSFELTEEQANYLFLYMTLDIDAFEARVEEVIAGHLSEVSV